MRIIGILFILIAAVCLPLLSYGVEVKVAGSTQYLWYPDFLVDEDQEEVAQYIRMNVTKLDKGGKAGVYGYGRGSKQTSSSEDANGRLYYLYLDYRDVIKDHLDFRAGRTYVGAAGISGTVDGLYLDVRNLGPAGITLFGGRRVIFDEKREVGTGDDTLFGGSLYINTIKNTRIEASYGRKDDEFGLARENVGLDVSTTPHDKVMVYGRSQYDTVLDKFNEVFVGAKVAPVKDLFLRGEYYQSRPTFDKASFYHFFNVNNYKELSISAEYRLSAKYQFNGKYAREDFGNDADADVCEVGVLARPINDLSLSAMYEKRNGFAGDLSGIRFNGGYKIARATLMAGIDYDDFKREMSREGTAKKYWGGINYQFSKNFSAVAKVEDNINYRYDNSYQGFAAINITF